MSLTSDQLKDLDDRVERLHDFAVWDLAEAVYLPGLIGREVMRDDLNVEQLMAVVNQLVAHTMKLAFYIQTLYVQEIAHEPAPLPVADRSLGEDVADTSDYPS